MFAPHYVPNFDRKVNGQYISNISLSAGALVDVDPTDTTAIAGSVGYSALYAGSVKLATVAVASTTSFGREFGVALPTVTTSGPSLIERILNMSTSYMNIPQGSPLAVYKPTPGDIIATDQFIGAVAGDSSLTGYLDVTNTANLLTPMGIYQGRFRKAQSGDAIRARFMGVTTTNGYATGMFEFA